MRSTASMPLLPCATTSTPPTESSRYFNSSRANCSSSMISAERDMQKFDCRKPATAGSNKLRQLPVCREWLRRLVNRHSIRRSLFGDHAQARRHLVFGQLLAAAGTELVGGANGAE